MVAVPVDDAGGPAHEHAQISPWHTVDDEPDIPFEPIGNEPLAHYVVDLYLAGALSDCCPYCHVEGSIVHSRGINSHAVHNGIRPPLV